MLRISKLADYGTVVMTLLAQRSGKILNAKDVATQTSLTVPTVSKILKCLAKAGLVTSIMGARGGYQLARPATEINVTQIVEAIDGVIALTECEMEEGDCQIQSVCNVSGNWRIIGKALRDALDGVSLQELAQSGSQEVRVPLDEVKAQNKMGETQHVSD